jgi:hypothetical protein
MRNKPEGGLAIPKKQSLKRVSPGVYRNTSGGLVGPKGEGIPSRAPVSNRLPASLPDGLLERLRELMGGDPRENPIEQPILRVDPRDPNIYGKDPQGNTIGTYIGWRGMGGKFNPEWAQVEQTKIPRTNSVIEKIRGS